MNEATKRILKGILLTPFVILGIVILIPLVIIIPVFFLMLAIISFVLTPIVSIFGITMDIGLGSVGPWLARMQAKFHNR